MVGNSDESGWRRPPTKRGISRSPPHPVASFRTVEGGFWYRTSLPYHRSLFCAPSAFENASRTGGGLFEHGTHIRYQRRPSPVPNANHPTNHPTTQPPNHLATTAHPALRYRMPQSQKWERHCLQRIYQTARKEEALQKRSPECLPSHSLRKPQPYFIANT